MKKTLKPSGSVLIWTVFLGLALSTAFFFFSQRLNFNLAAQTKAMEEQNAEQLLESYADYLESLSFEQLKMVAGELEFEGMTGALTNSATQIKGVVDAGQSLTYHVANGGAQVEWGLCTQNEAGRLFAVDPIVSAQAVNCSGGYDQMAETKPSTSFTLNAYTAPVGFKITPMEGAVLYDNTWNLELKFKISANESLFIQRSFVPVDVP